MKTYIKILIHAIFWIVYIAFSIALSQSERHEELVDNPSHHLIINLFWALAIFYLFYVYFIRYFEAGRYLKYLMASLLASIGFTVLFMPLHKLVYAPFPLFDYRYFGPPIIGTFVLAQCGSLVKGFENWVKNIQQKAEMENRNLKNELELLKSQINPHFLFNTIHNIDALIHKKPDEASRYLITMSEMLRYMIYETNTDVVPLEGEVNYLRKYIDLQKLRFAQNNFVNLELPEDSTNLKIAPMLLLPFTENAFKYAHSRSKPPGISITMQCDGKFLVFTCENSFDPASSKKTHSGGVGLENVKRRLQLIYPEQHWLEIKDKNNTFTVELKIDLS
jgi:two-component system, LytTR family, sensor kinase